MPFSQADARGLAVSLLFLVLLLGATELARRRGRVAADLTRKAFHAGLGSWALGAVYCFEHRVLAVALFVGVAALMYLSFRFELFVSVEDDGPSLGSVLLPLSLAALLAAFRGPWTALALAGAGAAAWGDTTAAIAGRRLGSRKYRIFGHARTMEGTLALFLASSAAMALVLGLGGSLGWHQAVAFALIAGTAAASVETASPYGADNLTVPLGASATLWALVSASGGLAQ